MSMKKKYFFGAILIVAVFSLLGLASNANAAAPQIVEAKFKAAGDSNKIAIWFDQPVYSANNGTGALVNEDFVLGGSAGSGATLVGIADHSTNPPSRLVVLTASTNIAVTGAGQWTITPGENQIFNAQGEAAAATPYDLNTHGDNTAPTVLSVFQHSSMNLDVMFSEEINSVATTSFANLVTSVATDTPEISGAQLVPEKRFAILGVSTSTVLNWGAGNTVDVGSVQDLVGNPISGTTTATILPPLKISEVKARSAANSQDEFIEIYNFGDATVDASNLYLHINNGSDVNKTLTRLKTQIAGHGFYLIGSGSSYSGTVGLDATYNSSSNDITANSGVYISGSATADQQVIDKIGMGTSGIFEGTALAALTDGKSYERKAQFNSTALTMAAGGSEEFKGNSSDLEDNASDFVLRDNPQSQNSSSPIEFPFGGPGANDSGAPTVMGTFPSGNPGEMVPANLDYIGFNFSESVNEVTVSSTTVLLLANGTGSNLCGTISFSNFPQPGTPPGKCIPSAALTGGTSYTFKILGGGSGVKDFNNNALSQPVENKGDGSGNYSITFTPQASSAGYTFDQPPVFVMGAMPFPGAFNIPANIQKVFIKFSNNIATSTVNNTNFQVRKVSDNSVVTISSAITTASEDKFTSDVAILNIGVALTANEEYKITVNNAQDTSGRTVSAYESRFTAGAADITGPTVTGKLPNIATGVPVNAIDIHIMTDDRLDASTISSSTVKVLQDTNEIAGSVEFDPFTGEIIFLASNVFSPSTQYTVALGAAAADPCVKNVSNLCLQDTDGSANNSYRFSFTTGSADEQGPQVMFANADQRNLSITFDEPINPLEAQTLDNYAVTVNGTSTALSSMAGHRAFYDDKFRTAILENLNLSMNASFSVTVSNIHDLSGNLIGVTNSAQGTVQDMTKTGGFVGPGGAPPPGTMDGGNTFMPDNFSSDNFGFVPSVDVKPMSPLVGAVSHYFVDLPISLQIPSATGKIVLTFPTGFEVTDVIKDSYSPMINDANGPGPGAIGYSLLANNSARTITITLTANTRCNTANVASCGGDTHDFLHFDLKGIVNSSIPKDAASGGYTVDVKTMDGATVLESLTSKPFFLSAGGNNVLQVNLTAAGANTGTTTVRMFSPMMGEREAVSTAFSGGSASAVFSNLIDGDYAVFTEPLITLGATDYLGRQMPTPLRVSGGGTTTMALTLQDTTALNTVTVDITAPSGKNIDVFANSADKFMVKTITTTGSDSVQLKLDNGTWFIGVGPAMPKGPMSGPPPAPDFVMQPPQQVIVSGPVSISFTLGTASLSINGTVVDASNKSIVNAEVFAYSPMGGFGTHGQTDASGRFTLRVGSGVYQVGTFAPGLPPASETSVEVRGDGTLIVNGQSTTTLTLKLIKPERTISGKVLDQSNNPVQGAGVFAYCDPSVNNNPCFGPGGHSGAPTNSDGSYTLYVKAGTWKVGAFLPGFGELPQLTKEVTTADLSNVNFSPSSSVTFNDIQGTVCQDTNISGTCGAGEGVSGAFVRAFSSSGSNQTVTNTSGEYTLKVPANANYTIEASTPSLGRLSPITGVDVTNSVTGQDFVIGIPRTITVNIKDSEGNAVTVPQMFVDFFNFSSGSGNHLEIKNANSGTITLPNGTYNVKASVAGKIISGSDIQSEDATTTTVTSGNLVVNGNEAIKIVLPSMATVSGIVYKGTAENGNELGDSFVQFINPSMGIFAGTQASSTGAYSLKLPFGTYDVFTQKPGYISTPKTVEVSTTTVSANLIATEATLSISGTITISGTPATRAFVRAEKLGGGFSGTQTDSNGTYVLPVTAGTWRLYAVSEGYLETEHASSPLEVSASVTGKNINLTTKVTQTAPKSCQIIPAQGGECVDTDNGVRVLVPPSALGSGTSAATLTIQPSNTRQQSVGNKPVGNGFDFSVVDSSGSKVSTFNSAVTLEFTQTVADLATTGINTKTEADSVKITLSGSSGNDVLPTTIEYLDGSNNLVASPAEDLANVTNIRFKAYTTHFSGGGPTQPGDSLAPSAPTAVSGTGAASSIGVSWTAPTTNSDGSALSDLSDYRVWRSTSASSGFAVLGTATTTSYTDSSASAGTTYYYRVTARDTSSNESAQSSSSDGVARSTASAPASAGGGFNAGAYYASQASTATTTATTTTATTTTATTTSATTTVATSTSTTTAVTTSQVIKAPIAKIIAKFTKTLRKGLKGADITNLQEFLAQYKDIYPEGLVTGYFGPATERAIKKFQEKYEIALPGNSGYGIVGPATRAKINELLSSGTIATNLAEGGASSEAKRIESLKEQIKLLQQKLIELLKLQAALLSKTNQ